MAGGGEGTFGTRQFCIRRREGKAAMPQPREGRTEHANSTSVRVGLAEAYLARLSQCLPDAVAQPGQPDKDDAFDPSLTCWQNGLKGSHVALARCNKVATATGGGGHSVCTAVVPSPGAVYEVEIEWAAPWAPIRQAQDGRGCRLHETVPSGGIWVGVLSKEAAEKRMEAFSEDCGLSKMTDGFWGMDDFGGGESVQRESGGNAYYPRTEKRSWMPPQDPRWGIRRGHGGTEFAPISALVSEIKYAHMSSITFYHTPYVFCSGDRLHLVVDMDQRTLTIYRNWNEKLLLFEDLPAEVHVAATLKTRGSTVRIVSVSPLQRMEYPGMGPEAPPPKKIRSLLAKSWITALGFRQRPSGEKVVEDVQKMSLARQREVSQLIDASRERPMTDDKPWFIRNVVQPIVWLYSWVPSCCSRSKMCWAKN